jgi:hypothetical protein
MNFRDYLRQGKPQEEQKQEEQKNADDGTDGAGEGGTDNKDPAPKNDKHL